MKHIIVTFSLFTVPLVQAGTMHDSWTIAAGSIPDNSAVGLSDTRNITVAGDSIIQSIQVDLEIAGGWNGDLYAYLAHGDNTAILLNRVGKTSGNPDGVGSSGMNVSLADSFAFDIHTTLPGTGTPTGLYQPDGRSTDPLLVQDTDPRDAMLSLFNGSDANGDWTLFIADQSAGDTSTIQSWGLTITTVPEPSAAVLALIGLATVLRRRRNA